MTDQELKEAVQHYQDLQHKLCFGTPTEEDRAEFRKIEKKVRQLMKDDFATVSRGVW